MKAILRNNNKVTTIGITSASIDLNNKLIQIDSLFPVQLYNNLQNTGFDVSLEGRILLIRGANITCTE